MTAIATYLTTPLKMPFVCLLSAGGTHCFTSLRMVAIFVVATIRLLISKLMALIRDDIVYDIDKQSSALDWYLFTIQTLFLSFDMEKNL